MVPSAEKLKAILKDSNGIFDHTETQVDKKVSGALTASLREAKPITFADIVDGFREADLAGKFTTAKGDRISFDIPPISIRGFIDAVNGVRGTGGESGIPLTHLGLYYGLDANNRMILIMRGVKFDDTDDGAKLTKRIPKENSSILLFTTSNLILGKPDESVTDFFKDFKKIFNKIHGKNKFVRVAYMKFDPLIQRLEKLEAAKFSQFKITFGYIDNKEPDGLSCFHVIFTGLVEDSDSRSLFPAETTFSTFDNLPGYDGPKPSCPPFGSVEADGIS